MFKKLFIAASLALTPICYAAPVENATVEAEAPANQPNEQAEFEAPGVDSEEVNTTEESFTAKRLAQLQKAKDLEESDSFGGAVTLVAMCIVLFALIVLSLTFMGFGKISSKMMSKKKLSAQGKTKDDIDENHEDVDSGEAIAAIAMALAEHLDGRGHDMEDTILTIRRMRRAYSPWNSKIYNLREVPQLRRNIHK